MRRLRAGVDAALGWLLAVLMGAGVANVVWQVFSRYVLRSPCSYTEELARYLLIWVGLLGAAYGAGRGMHLAIDLVPSRLAGPARRRLDAALALAVLAFALAVMVWGGGRLVWMTLVLGQRSAAMGVPLGYVYLALPVSGALMAFYAAAAVAGCPPPEAPRPDEAPPPLGVPRPGAPSATAGPGRATRD